MYAARDPNIHALLNCDDKDDEKEYKEFYVRNLHHLMMYPMPSVPYDILRQISVILHNTLLFHSDWQEYATKMGVTDNYLLAKIQASAKVYNEQELFITLKNVLQNKMFGHIITTLLDLERYDVLKQILPGVKKMLESNSATEVKEVASVHKHSSEFKAKELTTSTKESNDETVSVINSLSYNNTNKLDTCASSSALLDKHNKQEFNTLQQSSTNKKFTTAIHNISTSSELLDEESSIQEINLFPSTPAEERLSVFIQHSEFDSGIASELSAMLREGGIVVTTLSDMDKLVAMDNTRGALTTIFQEVDFIIPVVSEKFLQQIHPNVHEEYLESADTINNRWLYQLIMNEYISNRCVNFRVRPVIVPEMNRQPLTNDIVLSFSFRLWSEVPKLIKILKETKKLIPQFINKVNKKYSERSDTV